MSELANSYGPYRCTQTVAAVCSTEYLTRRARWVDPLAGADELPPRRNWRNDFAFDDNDDAGTAPRTLPPSRSDKRLSPLRFITPGTFGAAVVLFFLPWTELSCDGPTGRMQLLTQSGYQSAAGEASEGDGFAKLREVGGETGERKAGGKVDLDELRKDARQKGAAGKGSADKADRAPVLWIYLAVLAAGAVVPVFLAAHRARGTFVIGFAGLALFVLGLQAATGFPLADAAADFNSQSSQLRDAGKGAPVVLKTGPKMEMKATYLPSFCGLDPGAPDDRCSRAGSKLSVARCRRTGTAAAGCRRIGTRQRTTVSPVGLNSHYPFR